MLAEVGGRNAPIALICRSYVEVREKVAIQRRPEASPLSTPVLLIGASWSPMGLPYRAFLVISARPGLAVPAEGLVGGILRNEYTMGLEGCGKCNAYAVICPVGGSGCCAAGPSGFVQNR